MAILPGMRLHATAFVAALIAGVLVSGCGGGSGASQGDKDKAMADVDHVLKLKPDLPEGIRTRALLLVDRERFDEAASW